MPKKGRWQFEKNGVRRKRRRNEKHGGNKTKEDRREVQAFLVGRTRKKGGESKGKIPQ